MKEAVITQEREAILSQIKREAKGHYLKVKDWTHGLLHVEEVVEHIKVLAREEGLNVFFSEVTGWLHDIGRAFEEKGNVGEKSNHAYLSLKPAKEIMLQFEDAIPKEMRLSILEAIASHSRAVLPENASKLAKVLQDADRGAGMGHVGILRAASFVAGIEVMPTNNERTARHICENTLWETLKRDYKKRGAVIGHCYFMTQWYSGLSERKGEWKVSPMNTRAGKRRFKKDYLAIRNYQRRLLAL